MPDLMSDTSQLSPRQDPALNPGASGHDPRLLRQGLIWLGVLASFILLLWLLSPILLPFLVGAAVAYFLDPAVRRLAGWGLGRTLASVTMMSLLFGALGATLYVLVPLVVNEAAALANELPRLFEQAREALNRSMAEDIEDEDSTVRQILADSGQALRDNAQSLLIGMLHGVSGLIGFILFWVVMPVVAFYLLIDWPRLLRGIDDLLPREHAQTIRQLACQIDSTIAGFVRGEVIVCTILAVWYTVTLSLIGLNYALVIGLVAGLVSFIPYVGAFVGGSLAIGFALYQFWGDPWLIGLVVGVFLFGQFIETQVLVPRLVGSSVNLHPVWLIFAVMAFGSVFGLTGALVAVPVAAAMGVLVRFGIDCYRESRLYQGRTIRISDR